MFTLSNHFRTISLYEYRLVCKDIVNKKSSDHINVSTFIGALFRWLYRAADRQTLLKSYFVFRSSLFFRQGCILNLQTVIIVHGMGLFVNTGYLSLYWNYSSKKVIISLDKTLSNADIYYLQLKDYITQAFDNLFFRRT